MSTSAELLKSTSSLSQAKRIVVGPEGGLHPEELEIARQCGMKGLQLGPRVLRSETAVIAMTAILQFLFGDLANRDDQATEEVRNHQTGMPKPSPPSPDR